MAFAAPRILDRYVLHEEMASGGMAVVHFGQVLGAGGFARTVAIKRLHPNFAKDPEFAAMFLDEARLAARVRHPNVVTTLDVVATGKELCLVMEYVAGEPLSAILREAHKAKGRIPASIVAAIVSGALRGLHAAHEARGEDGTPLEIVHRDVSPQNLIIGADGIARASNRSHATRTGMLKGKLRYMAPEQLRGSIATRRSDIYAAGVVLWEALTGQKLWTGDTDAAIYGQILEGVIPPPSRHNPEAAPLDRVTLAALARDPSYRFQTALAMAEAIEACIAVAPPPAVGAFVEAIGGASLAKKARRVAEIEGRASRASIPEEIVSDETVTEAPSAASSPDATSTMHKGSLSVASRSDIVARPRSRRWPLLGATAVLAIFAGGAVAVKVTPRSPPQSARAGVGARALLVMLRAAPPPEPRAQDTNEPTATDAPSAAPIDIDEPAAPHASSHKPASSARARSQCDPPYTVDGLGILRAKPGCL